MTIRMIAFLIFFKPKNTPLCFLIYSSTDKYLGCFSNLSFVNNATINMVMQIIFQWKYFISFGYISIPRSGIAKKYVSILKSLGNLHDVSYGYTNLCSHQQYTTDFFWMFHYIVKYSLIQYLFPINRNVGGKKISWYNHYMLLHSSFSDITKYDFSLILLLVELCPSENDVLKTSVSHILREKLSDYHALK